MTDKSLQNTKAILKSLVVSQQGGLTIQQLDRDYKELQSCPIPFVELGFSRLETFLRSINDTLLVSIFHISPVAFCIK